MPVWAWVVLGVVALGVGVLLSPIFAVILLVVLITGIVGLAKNTRTWLRFRSRKVAMWVTAVSAVGFLLTGSLANVVLSAGVEDPASPAAATPDTSDEASSVTSDAATPEATAAASPAASPTPTPEATTPTPQASTALALLATLDVKGRAPKTGYDRDQFGQRWLDVDRNGCDTRNDTLARDLTDTTLSGPCKVMSGTLADPYTAQSIAFVRGQDTSADVQIDHVVALSDAWQKGAQQLTAEERARFANDPMNLLAVDGGANAQKGDGDAATWLPKNKAFRCAYVARQVSMKAAYGLWVTQAEHDAIARILDACPDEPVVNADRARKPLAVVGMPGPRESAAPNPAPAKPAPAKPAPAKPAAPAPAKPATPAEPAPSPAKPKPAPAKPAPAPADPAPEVVYYANCTAVREAGAAPIHAGDPGYSYKLDRDKDGIACE